MGGSCCETGGATSLDQVRVAGEAVTRVHVALAGQPNVGKSTIFNLLTGLNQHVGNWPGKTVEQKIGSLTRDDITLDIVDLPGTYSLTANSPEELIAREYILTQRPDVIVAIVDAAILERSLYLVAELVQLGVPLVVGLNMLDVATRHGTRIDTAKLSEAIGVPVINLIAAKKVGIDQLGAGGTSSGAVLQPSRSICPLCRNKRKRPAPKSNSLIAPELPEAYPLHWAALKLLEHDAALIDQLRSAAQSDRVGAVRSDLADQRRCADRHRRRALCVDFARGESGRHPPAHRLGHVHGAHRSRGDPSSVGSGRAGRNSGIAVPADVHDRRAAARMAGCQHHSRAGAGREHAVGECARVAAKFRDRRRAGRRGHGADLCADLDHLLCRAWRCWKTWATWRARPT